MINRTRLTMLTVCLYLSVIIWAQISYSSSFDHLLTSEASLNDYLTYAALNNPGLEAAFNRWKAHLERIPQAKALPDPKFNYGYFIEAVETKVGPQRQKFGIAQVFPWFGKLQLKENVAQEQAKAQKAMYDSIKHRLFSQVKQAYYDYYLLNQSIVITKKHIDLITRLETTARTRYKAGSIPYGTVINAQIELDKLHDILASQKTLILPVRTALNAAAGLPTDTALPPPLTLPEYNVELDEHQLTDHLLHANPELARIRFLSRKEDHIEALAKKSNWPDIMLGVDYIDTGKADDPGITDSGKDPVIAMASLNIPLWLSKNRAAVNEARLNRIGYEKEEENTRNSLLAQLTMEIYRFQDADRKTGLYRNSLLPKAEQSLAVVRQDFETSKASFNSVVEAERLLLEFELAFEQARTDRLKSLARIEQLTGQDLPDAPEKDKPRAAGEYHENM